MCIQDYYKNMKDNQKNGKHICKFLFGKHLVSRIYAEVLQLSNKKRQPKKKKDNPVKNGTVYLSNLVFKEGM